MNEAMNRYLNTVADYYKLNGLKCNTAKSNALLITGTLNRLTHESRRQSKQIDVIMDGDRVPIVSSLRYLGIAVNSKYNFVEHIGNTIRKMSSIAGMMDGLLSRKNCLSEKVKLAFYKAAVRSFSSYGFELWSGCSSHQMELLRRAERRFLRWSRHDRGRRPGSYMFVNSSTVYRDAGTQRIDAWMIGHYLENSRKMRGVENLLIHEMFDGHDHDGESRYKSPVFLAFENEVSPLVNQLGKVSYYNRRISDGAVLYPISQ